MPAGQNCLEQCRSRDLAHDSRQPPVAFRLVPGRGQDALDQVMEYARLDEPELEAVDLKQAGFKALLCFRRPPESSEHPPTAAVRQRAGPCRRVPTASQIC